MWKGFFKNEFLGCSGWWEVGFGWCVAGCPYFHFERGSRKNPLLCAWLQFKSQKIAHYRSGCQ